MNDLLAHLEAQLADLRSIFPETRAEPLPDGTTLITVPHLALPAGWNQSHTALHFLVPVGYPMANPDCFWADETLRLASGALPMNSAVNAVPQVNGSRLWFSWHVQAWNPATDDLVTYIRVVQNRMSELR